MLDRSGKLTPELKFSLLEAGPNRLTTSATNIHALISL
jgi:hypothetical protein